MKNRRQALTLVELVIVVLIIAILTAVSAPKYLEAYQRRQVDTAAMRIRADLNLSRQSAIAKSGAVSIIFDTDADNYKIPSMSGLDQRSEVYTVDLSASPYEVKLWADSFGLDGAVSFDMYGNPTRGGTLTLFADSYSQTVTLDPLTGKATIP